MVASKLSEVLAMFAQLQQANARLTEENAVLREQVSRVQVLPVRDPHHSAPQRHCQEHGECACAAGPCQGQRNESNPPRPPP